MGIIIRQSLKSTILSYAGILIGMVNVLWLMPEYFSAEQIGLVRLLQDIPLLIGSFMQLGAANIADRFFPAFKTEDGKHNGFVFLLLTYPFIGYLFFLLSYALFHTDIERIYQVKSALFTDYMHFLIPLSLFVMYSSIFETYARINMRIVVPTFIREIILRILFLCLVVGYSCQWFDFNVTILLYVLSYGCALFLLIVYTIATLKFFIQPKLDYLNRPMIKNIFSFVVYVVPGTAGSLIAAKIDTILIGAQLGLAEIGIYNLAFFIGSIVEMPKRALSQISIPVISSAWNRNDMNEIATLYKKSAINQALLGILIFLMIWLNIDTLLALVPKHEIFSQGKYVILFIGLGKLFDMATGVNSEIILNSSYYRFNLISMAILAVLTVATNFIFIQHYGINGVAFATLLSLVIYNGIKMIFLWMKLKIQPYDSSMIKLIGITACVLMLFYFWPQEKGALLISIVYITLRCTVITVVFISLILLLRVSEDFTYTFKNIFSILKTFKQESRK